MGAQYESLLLNYHYGERHSLHWLCIPQKIFICEVAIKRVRKCMLSISRSENQSMLLFIVSSFTLFHINYLDLSAMKLHYELSIFTDHFYKLNVDDSTDFPQKRLISEPPFIQCLWINFTVCGAVGWSVRGAKQKSLGYCTRTKVGAVGAEWVDVHGYFEDCVEGSGGALLENEDYL